MGKPFEEELGDLGRNISFALQHPIEGLRVALDKAIATGQVLVCGAGGSFSAAAFTQLLLENARVDAKTVSPLHFLQMAQPSQPASLILFSAAGKNKDVLRVVARAAALGIPVTFVCSSEGSPAAKALRKNAVNSIYDFSYPAVKDGFLAVNSLAVTWWLVARALGFSPPDSSMVEKLAATSYDVSSFDSERRHACLVLHDLWTKPVAIDLESKMAEAALCCPLVSDLRQFGHGRHHFLAKNASFTSVLSIQVAEREQLARKTLNLIPPSISKNVIRSEAAGVSGTCELLIQSFGFIGALGKKVGIDPGRPGVPRFGSALYGLSVPSERKIKNKIAWDLTAAQRRKADAMQLRQTSACHAIVNTAAENYLIELKRRRFGAVVLDFDGTVAPSGIKPGTPLDPPMAKALSRLLRRHIIVGFATGRGDSCHDNISRSVPEKYWQSLFISHYNGGSAMRFDELMRNPTEWTTHASLHEISSALLSDPVLTQVVSVHFKGPQITLRAKSETDRQTAEQITRTLIATKYSTIARLVVSSHTLDIVPLASSKSAIISHFRNTFSSHDDILTIGDRGDLYGNDFELLSHESSLSVDRVSANIASCWNFLPDGLSHQMGTIWYLSKTKLGNGHFMLT